MPHFPCLVQTCLPIPPVHTGCTTANPTSSPIPPCWTGSASARHFEHFSTPFWDIPHTPWPFCFSLPASFFLCYCTPLPFIPQFPAFLHRHPPFHPSPHLPPYLCLTSPWITIRLALCDTLPPHPLGCSLHHLLPVHARAAWAGTPLVGVPLPFTYSTLLRFCIRICGSQRGFARKRAFVARCCARAVHHPRSVRTTPTPAHSATDLIPWTLTPPPSPLHAAVYMPGKNVPATPDLHAYIPTVLDRHHLPVCGHGSVPFTPIAQHR